MRASLSVDYLTLIPPPPPPPPPPPSSASPPQRALARSLRKFRPGLRAPDRRTALSYAAEQGSELATRALVELAGRATGNSRRREFCHFADIPSPSMLEHLLKGEGGAVE